jgi:hypothetical protein
VLAIGGMGTPPRWLCRRTVSAFDPTTNTWDAAGRLHLHRCDPAVTVLRTGQVLVAGGWSRRRVPGHGLVQFMRGTAELYDPATDHWQLTQRMHVARGGAASSLLPNGHVLVAGGETRGHTPLATSEIYAPTTGTWRDAPSMPVSMWSGSAIRLGGGDVLVVTDPQAEGRHAAARYVVKDHRWIPAERYWSFGETRLFRRANGRVLALNDTTGPTHVYNPSRNHWHQGVPMHLDIPLAAVVSLRGLPLALGGFIPHARTITSGTDQQPGSDAAGFLLRPRLHVWQRWTSIPYIAWDFGALRLRDGSILVAGGWVVVPSRLPPGSKPKPISTVYRYFPAG